MNLTDSQLVILSAAANRDTGAVLPVPSSLTLNKGSAALVLKSLITRGLVDEQPAARGDAFWRETDDLGQMTLRITAAGLQALGLEGQDGCPEATGKTAESSATTAGGSCAPPREPTVIASPTKQDIIVALLQQVAGASLPEIMAATGWQAHSVRGAISGSIKKKLGLAVETFADESRGRIYRIGPHEPSASTGEVV